MDESGSDSQRDAPGGLGARRLAETLRRRWLIVAITVSAAVLGAVIYVATATPTYQAQAQMLISPETDPTLSVLPLFRSSSDPTQDTQTATLLIHTSAAASEAQQLLKAPGSAQALLQRVQVVPVAGSNVVAVIASAPTPAGAARLANVFAVATLDVLRKRLQAELLSAIPRLQAQVNQLPPTGSTAASDSPASQLAAVRALLGGPDPTIQLVTAATAPSSPSFPRRGLSVAAGALIGLVFGIAVALAAEAVDPRLRRESQLHDVLDLPVLARVPWLGKLGRPRSATDARQLRMHLAAHEFLAERLRSFAPEPAAPKRTIVFTSAHQNVGCTTVAVHHAWLLAAAGERVILLDGDPSQPAVGPATGAQPSSELEQVLEGGRPVDDALVPVEAGGVQLRVLAVQERPDRGFHMRVPMGRAIVAELLDDADVLVVDAPPLTESAPALVLARSVDCVVVVARIGETRLSELRELGELLANHGVRSAGIVLIGGLTEANGRHRVRAWRQALTRASRPTGSRPNEHARRSPGSADINPQHALTSGRTASPRRRGTPPPP